MPRLYLDSHDLIDVIAHERPVGPEDLRNELQARKTELVYSWASILETVNVGDLRESRSRLDTLDALPRCFILGLPVLIREEFATALNAFRGQAPLNAVCPWERTLHRAIRDRGPVEMLDLLLNYTLADFVMPLLYFNPAVCANRQQNYLVFMADVARDRARDLRVRRSYPWFRGGVGQILIRCGINLRQGELNPFAQWLWNNGSACSGWRSFHESYLEFSGNVGDRGERGDISDFSHMTAIPYVDAITLDRRMADYCRRAARKLDRRYPDVGYSATKIFNNLAEWLNS
jgi:hypothetical protein